jgi:hypothetical protein
MGVNGSEIEPFEKERKIPRADLHYLLGVPRPFEPMLLQSLLIKRKAVPVPKKDLEYRTPAVAKDE